MRLLPVVCALVVAIAIYTPATHGKLLTSPATPEDSTSLIRNRTGSLCSTLKGECVCKAHRRKEHSLVCLKKDCMRRLPTDKLSLAHASQIVSLLVRRQKSLTVIGADELRPLGNVRSLRLFQCRISSIAPDAFIGLNYVERLDLHRNTLTEVPKAIAYLRNLKSLNLGGNRISFIKPGAFYSNSKLKKLVLSRNLLEVMPTFFPASLVKLSVSYNKLTTLGNLASLENLEILHAESNEINDFPRVPISVKVLNLCGNQLQQEISVGKLVNLRKLSVSNNPQIGTIRLSTFRDGTSRTVLKNLTSLIAHNAGIDRVDANSFACLPNLQLLDLSGNKLYQFKPEWFIGNRKLRGIFLDENPWQCHCDVQSSLVDIQRFFEKRRNAMERKSRRRMTLSSRKSEVFKFANDFQNVSCLHSKKRRVKCTPFKLLNAACDSLGSSVWDVPAIVPIEPIPEPEPEIMTTVTTQIPTTTEPPTTSTTTTTTIPPTTTTSTEPPITTISTTPPTTLTSTTSSTRPPLTSTTIFIEKPTTKSIFIPPTINPNTPSSTSSPATPTTTTTTTTPTTTTTTTPTTTITTTPSTTTTTTTPTTTTTTTTTTTSTTTTTTMTPATTTETIQTAAIEWCLEGDGSRCAFPFNYKGVEYYECIGYSFWCSPTYKYTGEWDSCVPCGDTIN